MQRVYCPFCKNETREIKNNKQRKCECGAFFCYDPLIEIMNKICELSFESKEKVELKIVYNYDPQTNSIREGDQIDISLGRLIFIKKEVSKELRWLADIGKNRFVWKDYKLHFLRIKGKMISHNNTIK